MKDIEHIIAKSIIDDLAKDLNEASDRLTSEEFLYVILKILDYMSGWLVFDKR